MKVCNRSSLPGPVEPISFSSSATPPPSVPNYDTAIHGHRPIIGGIYTPNVRIRRMTSVEQRLAELKRLRCTTCNYEITSSWFFVNRRGIAKVLKPSRGHNACCVASKISHFMTVDGSISITDRSRNCHGDQLNRSEAMLGPSAQL